MLSASVVVVVLNAVDHIQECLNSLLAQDFPRERHEILVIDNDSTDGTREIIEQVCQQHPHVRMTINPVRGIAGSRQLAIQLAANPLIAFIDSDCVAPSRWLASLVSGFEHYSRTMPRLAAVGGSNVPPQEGRYYETLALFLSTYLGSHGSVQGRQFREDRPVAHLPTVNVLYDKAAVLQAGGFDVTFGNIGEDQDLSIRLQQSNFSMVYLAGCEVIHKMRPTLQSWLKNMFVYGKGRMWLMRKHPQNIKLVLLAPMILVASLPLLFFSGYSAAFLSPLIYFLCIFVVSLFEGLRCRRLRLLMPLFLLYVGTHLAYGFGEWTGLFKNRELHRMNVSPNSVRER